MKVTKTTTPMMRPMRLMNGPNRMSSGTQSRPQKSLSVSPRFEAQMAARESIQPKQGIALASDKRGELFRGKAHGARRDPLYLIAIPQKIPETWP
jgi:hypothetical protein